MARAAETRTESEVLEGTELVREAGLPMVSWFGVLAGVTSGYGVFAVLLAVLVGVATAAGLDEEALQGDWGAVGAGGAAALAGAMLVAWLFGGYVAGRVARRAGLVHGALVLAGAILLASIAGLIVAAADTGRIADELRSVGIPTTTDEWRQAGTAAGATSLIALVAGALCGGVMGERWHRRLARRALDPAYGSAARVREAAAQNRRRAAEREEEARRLRVEAARLEAEDRERAEVPTEPAVVELSREDGPPTEGLDAPETTSRRTDPESATADG